MLRRHPEILRARLVISGTTGADRMVLKTESRVRGEDLAKRIADSLRDLTSCAATWNGWTWAACPTTARSSTTCGPE